MRLIIWKFIIQTLSIIGLNRRVIIFKEYPTTIWGLDHMTMLNACAEAHAFATLMLWKGGILGVLLTEAQPYRLAQELGRPAQTK